jgi:hypothetical protein
MANRKLHPEVQLLLADIANYLSRSGMDRTTFGRRAMHDGNFIPRLEAGRQPTFKTIARVRAYINRNTKAVLRPSQVQRRNHVT